VFKLIRETDTYAPCGAYFTEGAARRAWRRRPDRARTPYWLVDRSGVWALLGS
jgi:hypothetical protein